MDRRPVVAVIGAGFSGLLTALQLVAQPDGPRVRLIERRGVFGRGLAYSTDNADHLLNVRVANMSAFPAEPNHFIRWLSAQSGWRSTGGFVTRGVYGDYLQSLLRDAIGGGFSPDRLLLEGDEANAMEPAGQGWRITTAMGREILADAVVLAIGAPAPAPLDGLAPSLLASDRYIPDPWSSLADDELGSHIALIGTGLTMVDVVLSLARPGRRFTVISRRGLLPATHAPGAPAPEDRHVLASPIGALAHVRRQARTRDWREVVDEVRGSVRPLWSAWSVDERRRFLRHLRPWWEAARHRMAPPVAHRIEDLIRDGVLTVHAGATRSLALAGEAVDILWRPRRSRSLRHLQADTVINCTGSPGDIRHACDPVIRSLLAQDLIRPDACDLGADVDPHSRLLGADGAATPGLYAVGPLTRGLFWEITSVPDIRLQAHDVARNILGRCARADNVCVQPSADFV